MCANQVAEEERVIQSKLTQLDADAAGQPVIAVPDA